jgi:hypothetical protein
MDNTRRRQIFENDEVVRGSFLMVVSLLGSEDVELILSIRKTLLVLWR